MIEWEKLKSTGGGTDLYRSKIPGGWLVYFENQYSDSGTGGLTFVPDPDHEWDGASLE
jgi:hypothetical protein